MSTLTAILPAVNFAFPATRAVEVADDFRPTAGPDYTPTAEEEAEAAELLNADEADSEPDWDAMAEDAAMMDRYCLGCYAS
jgi:hypothetical protein